jgi:DNA polymerase III delta prime subunit
LARSAVVAERVLADAVGRAGAPVPVDPHKVPFGYWHVSPTRGPSRSESAVTVEPWATIRRNYTARTAVAVDQLMALGPNSLRGRLLLLHGPPGTGKTTMLRALSIAWRRWCRLDCVLDPERLFNDPTYLLAVGLAKDRSETDDVDDDDSAVDDPAPWWRLLVLEDCDELICPGAKSVSGQALARLLNVTDGLFGHGHRLLVAITTNEPLAHLHPAVTRPGRCLAQIEVGRFTREEARGWLGRDPGGTGDGATLAELYALANDAGAIGSPSTQASVGLYL